MKPAGAGGPPRAEHAVAPVHPGTPRRRLRAGAVFHASLQLPATHVPLPALLSIPHEARVSSALPPP
ncbi:MAG: hypothetical protein ACJ78X_05845, partial [Myxococcales bacterium]